MRAGDIAAPAIPAHPIPPGQPSAAWGAVPIVGLEYLPQGDTWDDIDTETVTWDAGLEWDDPETAAGYTDAWCDTTGVEIVHGEPDDRDLVPPSRCTLTLFDPTGKYRRRTPDGRLTFYAPGRRLVMLARIAGVDWWVFRGRIATWRDMPDGFVEITAYSCTAALAQTLGRTWTAGVDAERLGARAAAILAASGVVGVTLEAPVGTVTLTKPPAEDVAPLEALQRAAWSDGGIVYADADDVAVVRDRTWRDGRGDEPGLILSDNVCSSGTVIVWDAETAHDDEWLAGRVTLSTDAPPGLVATASNPAETIDPNLIYTHPDTDLWRLQSEGDALAAWIATLRGAARLAVALARVHLHDARFDYWRQMIDLRLTDRVRWLHEDAWPDGTLEVLDVSVIVHTIRHLITPETWTVEVETTPAMGYTPVLEWDVTSFTYDDADPNAVWR